MQANHLRSFGQIQNFSGPGGVLVIDKPAGLTSHDVVARLRRLLQARAGHMGTLDPAATGVLPVLIGSATRLMRFFQNADKEYIAVVRLGIETDSCDLEGRVISRRAVSAVAPAEVQNLLARFTGPIDQRPPMFSAVKVGGERLYHAARRGEERDRPVRRVTIHALELLSRTAEEWTLRIGCTSGTYIRSLASEIGKTLGCGASLARLRRTRSGCFDLSMAVSLDQIDERWSRELIPLEALLPEFPRLDLEPRQAIRVRHGNTIPTEMPAGTRVRLFAENRLTAIGEVKQGVIQPVVVLEPAGRPET